MPSAMREFVSAVILLLGIASTVICQTNSANPPAYRNEALRMSVRTPEGWTFVEDSNPAVERAKRLFTLRQNSNQNRTIAVSTEDATGNPGIYQVEPKVLLEALTKDSIEEM